MHLARLLMMTIVAAGAPAAAAAQAWGDTSPRDVRDIFLALPFPDDRNRVTEAVGERLSTRARRAEALRDADIDLPNGWLRVNLPAVDDDQLDPEVILTYFNRPTGRRLVVLQVTDLNGDGPWTVDYAWELEGSTFARVDVRDYLPNLEYIDFWDDPRPEDVEKDFFFRMDAYHIEWPRRGTTATFHVFAPRAYLGRPLDAEMEKLFAQRTRTGVHLLWDRRRGRFTKGEYVTGETDEDHEDHDHRE